MPYNPFWGNRQSYVLHYKQWLQTPESLAYKGVKSKRKEERKGKRGKGKQQKVQQKRENSYSGIDIEDKRCIDLGPLPPKEQSAIRRNNRGRGVSPTFLVEIADCRHETLKVSKMEQPNAFDISETAQLSTPPTLDLRKHAPEFILTQSLTFPGPT
ncbi:hypothetical protein WN48_07892 [Eufriesea mexicana]|uniref:Uncharacterized protein n=1 Tax=Eufriesea mexicana TaxID=516756 RepID=A0A310SPI7_9HYME|nr:hypothetical protein WN48_07892 [Eufriesea mexicana]